jgi:pimeloyl-ACP methyl ester carboxylesterase
MKPLKAERIILIVVCFMLFSCSGSDHTNSDGIDFLPGLEGSGSFIFTDYSPLATKPVEVYFHIPIGANSSTPIIFLFHGDNRNAKDYRDALINKSEAYNFILIAPEFSEVHYPTGDQYNLGNVFVDGDNPSSATLNTETVWTFSIIEPLFDYIKETMLNTNNRYSIIGHSAGGQFAHRFVMFKPNARFDNVIASASGWYTVPDVIIDFPYGFKKSPLENLSFSILYSKKLHILVGSADNDPNSPGLRHNPQADAQGLNRLDRANYFYNYSSDYAQENAIPFQWQITIAPGLNHDYSPAINYAVDLIFN